VDEVRQVGSFKHGTILAGHKTADFVVILKTLPTKTGVEALHTRVSDELKQTDCKERMDGKEVVNISCPITY
jgi:interleukin enhancer-binding factor 2